MLVVVLVQVPPKGVDSAIITGICFSLQNSAMASKYFIAAAADDDIESVAKYGCKKIDTPQ
jgi:hypothetical protein